MFEEIANEIEDNNKNGNKDNDEDEEDDNKGDNKDNNKHNNEGWYQTKRLHKSSWSIDQWDKSDMSHEGLNPQILNFKRQRN